MTLGDEIREEHPKLANLSNEELAKHLCTNGVCDRCYMRRWRESFNRVKACHEEFGRKMKEPRE